MNAGTEVENRVEDQIQFDHEDRDELALTRPMHRAVLRDRRLSFAARALFMTVWDFPKNFSVNKNQLSNMTNEKPGHIKSLFKELLKIGGFETKPMRLTKERAAELNKKWQGKKVYRAGQVVGQTWLVRHPKNWAIEHNLKGEPLEPLPEEASTVCIKNRTTVTAVPRRFRPP